MTSTRVADLQQRFLRLQQNKLFEIFVISVIVLSALLVGAKTYDLPPAVGTVMNMLDVFITLFFLTELSIRFIACENKRRFFLDPWNVFDTLIVAVSLIPISNSEAATVGRLVRVFRVLRMVSIIPELRLLLNSLLAALPQLGYLGLLMFIIFYIFAALGSTLFAAINPELWGDIAISMLTLFRVMTFEDWTDVMYETMAVYPFSWAYYMLFIFLTAFAFLNMVIGVVVGVMEDETRKARTLDEDQTSLDNVAEQLTRMEQQILSLQNQLQTDMKKASDH